MRLGEDRGAARSGNAVVSRRPCPVPRLTVFGRSPKPVKIEVFAKTDLGKTRDHNEDRFLVADLTRGEASLQPAVREHEVGERGSLFIVADGMGGAAAGELASEMATETIYEQMIRMWGNEKDVTPQRFAYRLKEAVKVDLTYQEVRKGDVLVLCSDGLSGQVKKEEIAEIVTRERDLQEACDRLIALANERGGPDNVTVVLARFDGDGLRSAAAGEEVGHQVYPLIDTEVSTEPVPVYRGSRPPLPARENRWRVVAAAVLAAAAVAVALYLATRSQRPLSSRSSRARAPGRSRPSARPTSGSAGTRCRTFASTPSATSTSPRATLPSCVMTRRSACATWARRTGPSSTGRASWTR